MHSENYIVISPYSRKPKIYPHWKELIPLLPFPCIQLGITGEKPVCDMTFFDRDFKKIETLITDPKCLTFIAVDNFLPHFAALLGKPGNVIFALSDPKIFGYSLHNNILKSRESLRAEQFSRWPDTYSEKDIWFTANEIINHLVLPK